MLTVSLMNFAEVDLTNLALGIVSFVIALGALLVGWHHLRELRRTRDGIQEAQQKTEKLRTEMLAALEIHELVVTDGSLERYVRRLSGEYARLLKHGDPLQLRLAKREVERATQLVRMGAEGHLMIGADSFADAETLASIILDTSSEGDEFWASSLVDSEFWVHAAAYVRQQHEKIEDGVRINRVFVFESQKAFSDPHAQQQMALQKSADINVMYVVKPNVAARDLAVVRRRLPAAPSMTSVTGDTPQEDGVVLNNSDGSPAVDGVSHNGDPTDADSNWKETYALECKVGSDKRIEHIDLWSVNELQSEMVRRTWWALRSIFSEAKPFELAPADAESRVGTHSKASSEHKLQGANSPDGSD
jgi:hypothetical protein